MLQHELVSSSAIQKTGVKQRKGADGLTPSDRKILHDVSHYCTLIMLNMKVQIYWYSIYGK